MKNNLEAIKKACEDNNLEFERFVHASFLTVELGNSFKPTVDVLDDLYCGLVGGVMYNLGSGKTPMIMEGIGPDAEDRNTLESWEKLRSELIYGLGGVISPFIGIKLIDILISLFHLSFNLLNFIQLTYLINFFIIIISDYLEY